MDWVKIWKNSGINFKKYQYAVLILILGVMLMLLPGKKGTEQPAALPPMEQDLAEELTEILQKVQGAGKVQVLLTEKTGQETLYQTDEETNPESGRSRTVVISDRERGEGGLIRSTIPARYLGAVVVCQGADRPGVRLSVVSAVCSATGLGADRVSVLKMK